MIRDIAVIVEEKLSGRKLPKVALVFIANHIKGATSVGLANFIGVKYRTLANDCRKGIVKAEKRRIRRPPRRSDAPVWFIPLNEVISLCDLTFNYIRLAEALREIGADEKTFGKDLDNGRLKVEIKIDRFGFKSIDRNVLPMLKEEYQAIRRRLRYQHGFRLRPKKNEFSLRTCASRLGVTYKTAERWLLLGYLIGQKVHGKWLITFEDLRDFIEKTLDGAFPIITRHRIKLQNSINARAN